MSTEEKIRKKMEEITNMMLEKNKAYGDSALSPLGVFSRACAEDAIKIRLDDKLARIRNRGITPDTEDTLLDATAYMVLLLIAREDSINN